MRSVPDRRILFRWMFDGLGFLLIFAHEFVVHTLLRTDWWAGFLFGPGTAGYAFFMAAAYFYLLPTPLLCWMTAAGLKRNKGWARPLGICTSTLLLLGFPWLTAAGAIGLYVLCKHDGKVIAPPVPTTKPTADFWESKRRSKAQPIVGTVLWIAAFFSQAWFSVYARRVGMPSWNAGWKWWPLFFGFVLFHIALHEFGHSLAAKLVGFKVRIISIGPFTFWRENDRVRFRFVAARLFESGGYMGAVPVSEDNLRWKQVFVVAAGPLSNLITCLLSLRLFFSLPGTTYQNWWWIVVLNVSVSAVMAVGNLLPLGYCDGSMLLHLILWTPAGQLLLDRQRVVQLGEEAEACHARADFDRQIRIMEEMVERSREFGNANALMIAACEQALGTAHGLVDDWPSAENCLQRALEFGGELAANPALAANVWSGLHMAQVHRHDLAVVGQTYASTVAILNHRRQSRSDHAEPAVSFAMMAQAHLRNGSYQAALEEIEGGLATASSRATSLRAHLLRSKAVCLFHRGDKDAARAAAYESANLFRSTGRNLGWEDVADLGQAIWIAGDEFLSLELMREGIERLESGGAAGIAGKYRTKLAGTLRVLGDAETAWRELPLEAALSAPLRRSFLAERTELHLALGRPDDALADGRRLVELWRNHPCRPALETASAGALLSKACLAAEDWLEAEGLAIQAFDVLGPHEHPDAAVCLVTLAVVRSDESRITEALRLIDHAPLLGPAEKARRRASVKKGTDAFSESFIS